MYKKILSGFMALVMMFSLMTVVAFADEAPAETKSYFKQVTAPEAGKGYVVAFDNETEITPLVIPAEPAWIDNTYFWLKAGETMKVYDLAGAVEAGEGSFYWTFGTDGCMTNNGEDLYVASQGVKVQHHSATPVRPVAYDGTLSATTTARTTVYVTAETGTVEGFDGVYLTSDDKTKAAKIALYELVTDEAEIAKIASQVQAQKDLDAWVAANAANYDAEKINPVIEAAKKAIKEATDAAAAQKAFADAQEEIKKVPTKAEEEEAKKKEEEEAKKKEEEAKKAAADKAAIAAIQKVSVKIAKAKAGKKKATVTWKVTAGDKKAIKGYELKYKNGKSKKWKVVAVAKTKKVVKKLKSGKKLPFKVRAYAVVGGKKYASKWSKAKYAKIK